MHAHWIVRHFWVWRGNVKKEFKIENKFIPYTWETAKKDEPPKEATDKDREEEEEALEKSTKVEMSVEDKFDYLNRVLLYSLSCENINNPA